MLMHIDPRYVGCREIDQFLYDYAERELDERLLMAFDSHLLGCQRCQNLVYSYQKSNETVQQTISKSVPIPADFKERLASLLHSDKA